MTATLATTSPARLRTHDRARVQAAARRPSEATYRRRRALVAAVLAATAATGVLVAPGLGGRGASAGAASGLVAVERRVTAQPGDTLWSIARQHRGGVPLTRYVDALVDLNGGPEIQAGQSVRLP